MPTRYFEDFQVGEVFELGSTSVSAEEIIAFARQYDPQPFHIDPEQAAHTVFGTLIASGWHSAALFMRLLVDGLLNDTISMGSPGIDELRWRKPVLPDEKLHARLTVLECTASRSRPNMGVVRSHCELANTEGVVMMSFKGLHLFGRRPETPQSR